MDKNKKHGWFQLSKIVCTANVCITNKWLLISALPGGYRNNNGTYNNMGNNGYWWTSREYSSTNAWKRNINYNNGVVNRNNNNKTNGFSVRCLRDLLDYCLCLLVVGQAYITQKGVNALTVDGIYGSRVVSSRAFTHFIRNMKYKR